MHRCSHPDEAVPMHVIFYLICFWFRVCAHLQQRASIIATTVLTTIPTTILTILTIPTSPTPQPPPVTASASQSVRMQCHARSQCTCAAAAAALLRQRAGLPPQGVGGEVLYSFVTALA